ncbi:MAG: TonB-dependent hemoglobin/transferrin/lactoferrin family receptor [Geminicoccaceae bacterium]
MRFAGRSAQFIGSLVAAMPAMVASADGWAQDEAGVAAQPLVTGGAILDPITNTATSNPVQAFEYPGQVTVVGPRQLEIIDPSKVSDILNFIPGVTSVGGPRASGEVPSIRGFTGPDVSILFDGVRQNFNSGHDGRLFIDPDLLAAVEVVRGPTSALYGSGGLGGTIEFRTLTAGEMLLPGETLGARVKGGYGSNATDRNANLTTFGSKDGFDLLGSITYRDSDDIELGNGETLDDDRNTWSGLLSGSYDGIENHRFELSYLGFRGDVTEPANPQGTGSGGDNDKDQYNDTLRGLWRWTDPTRSWLDLGVLAYYVRNKVDEEALTDDSGFEPGTVLGREVSTYGVKVDNRTRLAHGEGIHSLLTYGVETFYDDQNGSSSASADGEREGVPDADATTFAVFLQNELTLTEPLGIPGQFLVVPGMRYDHFRNSASGSDSTSDGAFSPKLGVSYLPVDWLLLFANYAHAFRAPTFDELYADGLHFSIPGFGNNFFVANPDLKPENTHNYEVGTGVQFDDLLQAGDEFHVKGSYFWIHGNDFIDLSVDQPVPPECFPPNCNGTTQADNVADAKLHGIDIEGGYESKRFLLIAGYSTLDGEDEDTGRPLGVLQPNKFTAQFGIKLPEIDAIVGTRAIIAGRLDRAEPGEERDAYQTYDLFAAWQPTEGPLRGLRVDAGVNNLTDKTYSTVYTDAAEQGRDYRVGVSYRLAW